MPLIYALAVVQMLIFVGITYGLARAFGLAPRVIALGLPAVVRVRKARPEVRIGILPTASVELAGEDIVDGQRVTYSGLSRTKRAAIVLVPWVAILAIAIGCIGVASALRSFARGVPQMLFTVDVTPLVRRMIAIADDAPVVATGILFAKLVAMNLLPLGGLAGGMLIMQLATPAGQDVPSGVMKFMTITMFAWMLWALGRLVYAIVQLV